jgi:hypothetical protein
MGKEKTATIVLRGYEQATNWANRLLSLMEEPGALDGAIDFRSAAIALADAALSFRRASESTWAAIEAIVGPIPEGADLDAMAEEEK